MVLLLPAYIASQNIVSVICSRFDARLCEEETWIEGDSYTTFNSVGQMLIRGGDIHDFYSPVEIVALLANAHS